MGLTTQLGERGWLPDGVLRAVVRRRLRARIRSIEHDTAAERDELISGLVAEMDQSPLAATADTSPAGSGRYAEELFGPALGRRRKSDCCFWPRGTPDLDAAEEAMLERTCANAGLEDGMEVLDLGWGLCPLALWVVERYPSSRAVAVTGGEGRQLAVERMVRERGLDRVEVVGAGFAELETEARFDRVFAIETFAGTRNYGELMRRIGGWLRPDGRALAQIACHRRWPYLLERGWPEASLWGQGLMPSDDLLYRFQGDLEIEHQWSFSGEHYQRTAEAWLARMDQRHGDILATLEESVAPPLARVWFRRWRILFLVWAEQFGFHRGQEWWVNHYLLRPRG